MGFDELAQIAADARAAGEYVEGSISPAEMSFLQQLVEQDKLHAIAEIGFNAGFSSFAFLEANPDAQVISFDLGEHPYAARAKHHIDTVFPGRHTLIVGDSRVEVPRLALRSGPSPVFDLIFIDGGHDYEVAIADIRNMAAFADADTVVVIDDLLPHKHFGVGPVRAWAEAIGDGVVAQTALLQDGVAVDVVDDAATRAWAVGRYVAARRSPSSNVSSSSGRT